MSFNIDKYNEINALIIEKNKENTENKRKIVAITKNQPLSSINEAILAGVRYFGENKVQEAETKYTNIKKIYKDLQLHLTGPLQTNKVKKALKIFDFFHTLDREKLALEISKNIKDQTTEKYFFVQVNTGKESQKSGIFPENTNEFFLYCKNDLKLNVIGLMCIPPIDDDPKTHFLMLKELATKCNLSKLSMGMSQDYKIALECSATHIRVGTALFGKRNI